MFLFKSPSIEHAGEIRVSDPRGLDVRVATRLSMALRRYRAEVTLALGDDGTADARDLIELLSLGARYGERLRVRTVGADAVAAFAAVEHALVPAAMEGS